jgi:cation transport ATPase
VEDFSVLPGKGVSGVINQEEIYGGNARLMEEIGIEVSAYSNFTVAGKTPLYFASKQRYFGAIVAADVLKTDTVDAIQALKEQHLDVVMLTGDNRKTAEAIGNLACITHIISDVLPGDEAGVIKELQQNGHNVLMVGDGINDAPALVTADIGMAIGNGTDIAVESADIVLMNGSLASISRAISLSKATIRNIKQNLFWAFFYNCLGIPIAAGVLYPVWGIHLSPMLGAAAMSFSSVFVVTNALRLRFFKPKMRYIVDKNISKEEIQMETIITVEGMMCTHCKARVESVCKAIAGVQDAVVDLQAKTVTVIGSAAAEELKKAITEAGYDVIE